MELSFSCVSLSLSLSLSVAVADSVLSSLTKPESLRNLALPSPTNHEHICIHKNKHKQEEINSIKTYMLIF